MKKSHLQTGRDRILFFRPFLLLAAISVAGIGTTQTSTKPVQPPVTLHVGDMAPPVTGVTWLKGQPVTSFTDGSIHVVEFWATWCGPCKAAMPELSRLAEQYKGRVTFTGLDIWETLGKVKDFDCLPKVKQFVDCAKGMMAYNVGADDPAADIASTWMIAAGQQGIPTTFVIDGSGRIEYIGRTIFLSEILPKILDHSFDAKAFSVSSKAEFDKYWDIYKEIAKAGKERNLNKVLELLDNCDRTIPWCASSNACSRYGALAVSDPGAAHTYGESLLKKFWNSPLLLCIISRTILSPSEGDISKDLGGIKAPDYPLALEAAEAAQQYSAPSDVLVNMTLAQAYFKNGNTAEAAEYQSRAVKTLDEDKTLHYTDKDIAEAKTALESYRAAGSSNSKQKAGQQL